MKQKITQIVLVVIMVFGGSFLAAPINNTKAANTIDFSAYVVNEKNEVFINGEYPIRFAMYSRDRLISDPYPSDSDAGVMVWSEVQNLHIYDGHISAEIGSVVPFPAGLTFNNGDYYFGIRIGTDSEMVPRKKIGSVPSAVNAAFLDGLSVGKNIGDIAQVGNVGNINLSQLPVGKGSKQLVVGSDKRLHLVNEDTGTNNTTFNIGNGTSKNSSNFALTVSNSSSQPQIRFNGSKNIWEFSTDGNNFRGFSSAGTQNNGIGFYDNSNSLGANGMLLSSTGNGTAWINSPSPAEKVFELDPSLTSPSNPYIAYSNGEDVIKIKNNGFANTTSNDPLNGSISTFIYLPNTSESPSLTTTTSNGKTALQIGASMPAGKKIKITGIRTNDITSCQNCTDDNAVLMVTFSRDGSIYNAKNGGSDRLLSNDYPSGVTFDGDYILQDPIRNDITVTYGDNAVNQNQWQYDYPVSFFASQNRDGWGNDPSVNSSGYLTRYSLNENNWQALTNYGSGATNPLDLAFMTGNVGIVFMVLLRWFCLQVLLERNYLFPQARLDIQGSLSSAIVGSEQIVNTDDSDFTTDNGHWTGVNWSITGGEAVYPGGYDNIYLNSVALVNPVAAGKIYRIDFTLNTVVSNQFQIIIGGSGTSIVAPTLGVNNYSVVIEASDATGLYFAPYLWQGSIDNVSIKEITKSNSALALRNSDGSLGFEMRTGGLAVNSVLIGTDAGRLLTAAADGNVALGYQTLANDISGRTNTAIGRNSMTELISGQDNVAVGTSSLRVNVSGSYNTAIGRNALNAVIDGYYNTAVGNNAGSGALGSSNIFLGNNVSSAMSSGSHNILIGTNIDLPTSNTSDYLNIGNILYGDLAFGNVGIGTITPAAKLDIQGISSEAIVGPEMIIASADRDLSVDTGHWTGTGWTIAAGNATCGPACQSITLSNTALTTVPVAGKTYQISFNLNTTVAASSSINPTIGGQGDYAQYGMVLGQHDYVSVITAQDSSPLNFWADTVWQGQITNISLKEITISKPAYVIRNVDGSIGLEARAGGSDGLGNNLRNIFIGNFTGMSNSTGSGNAAFGDQSFMRNTTGIENSAFGNVAMSSNTTGSDNSAFGRRSLDRNISGSGNSAFGVRSLQYNLDGVDNSAFGTYALYSNVSGSNNVAMGTNSLYAMVNGSWDTAIGKRSLGGLITGDDNTALGNQVARNLVSGNRNTFIGKLAGVGLNTGEDLISGDNNIFIGYAAVAPNQTGSNQLNIGNTIYGDLAAGMIGLGDTALANWNGRSILQIDTATDNRNMFLQAHGILDRYMISMSQDSSAFTGGGISMNFANGSGSFSGKYLSFANNGVENFNVDSTGGIHSLSSGNNSSMWSSGFLTNNSAGGGYAYVGQSGGNAWINLTNDNTYGGWYMAGGEPSAGILSYADNVNGTNRLNFAPDVLDGPTAVAYKLDTSRNLIDAGAKLLSIRNNGIEKFGINANGNVGIGTINPGTLLTIAGVDGLLNQSSLSVDQMQLSQLEGGSYFGRVGLTENQWNISNGSGSLVQKSAPIASYRAMAMSSNGRVQTAAVWDVTWGAYSSTDYGNTWVKTLSTAITIQSNAMSIDGKIQTLLGSSGQVFYSSDYGATWTQAGASLGLQGRSIAMSSDGKIQSAATTDGISISTDFGVTWTLKDANAGRQYYGLAMSSDGKIQTAVINGNSSGAGSGIFMSTDYGNTWSQSYPGSKGYQSVAMSSDGKIQTAVAYNDGIYVSVDYGVTWVQRNTLKRYTSVAMSSDGKIQTVVLSGADGNGQGVYVSSNYGTNWSQKDGNSRNYSGVAMSSDGKTQSFATLGVDGIYSSSASSYIYGNIGIGTTTPAAMLQIGSATNGGNVRIDNGWLCVDNNGTCTGAATAGTVYAVNAYTTGADYAEYFFTNDIDLAAGEAVCIDPAVENGVKRCQNDGDNNIMGIVSSNPSIVGNKNHAGDSHYKIIGMLGQVSGKISSENGIVKVGDSLTAAIKPGEMRKANAGESTVGIALQNFSGDNGSIQVLISRRNQSLTVEKVEQAVTDNIAAMNIKDQVNALVAKAGSSLDSQITTQTAALASMQNQITDSVNIASKMQAQIDLIRQENAALIDLATVLNVKSLIYKDSLGNLDLLDGKLAAAEVEAGALTIKIVDPKKATMGQGIITKVTTDTNNDGIDDVTGSNGKTVEVKTESVDTNSKIYLTPMGTTKNQVIYVGEVKPSNGFDVDVDNAVTEDINFNWWIVGNK